MTPQQESDKFIEGMFLIFGMAFCLFIFIWMQYEKYKMKKNGQWPK